MKIITSYSIFYMILVVFITEINTSTENNRIETKCPELSSSTLDFNCLFDESIVSCNGYVQDGTIATLKCKDHYYINSVPYNEIQCEKGQWNLPLFICEPIKCPELFSTSLSINCLFENETTPCDEPMLHGTTASLKCKDHYYIDSLPYNEVLCDNGQWNLPLFNCEPVCGIRTPKGTPLVVKGSTAEVGDFPWHVGLYEKITWNTRRYICGGSIISPKLLLTAAHCFISIEPRRYDVTAGKYYREWNNTENDRAQYRDIVEIIMSKEYNAQLTSFTADIAILVVDRVFILSDLVLPVCVDYNLRSLETVADIIGEVPGWGLVSERGHLSDVLQYTKLPLIPREKCLDSVPEDFTLFVTLDKICAGYTNGTSVCEGDSGGGLVRRKTMSNNTAKYFVIGIVSTSPFKEDSCDSYEYSTFTNVANHIIWINETKFKYESWSPYDYGCSMPDPPSYGKYTILDSPDDKKLFPGSIVPHYTKLKYSCDESYEIYGPDIITCKDKMWNDNIVFPACYRTCPDLVPAEFMSSEIYIRYSLEKKKSGFTHETQAFFNCIDNTNFELEEPGYNQTTCRDGKWIKPILKCVPICGLNNEQKMNYFDEQLVEEAYSGKYPWHAALYRKIGNEYKFACTATIISRFVLIIDKFHNFKDSLENYVVVMGSSNITFNSTNKNIQMSSIFKIIRLPETVYYGFYTTLVILKKRLNITPFVRPVCVDKKYISDKKGYVEMPVWLEGNDTLKNLKLSFRYCNLGACSTDLIDTKETHVIFGFLVRPIKSGSKIKYYIMSEIGNKVEEKSYIELLNNVKFDLLLKNMETFNIESSEMSECTVPNITRHGHFAEYYLNVGQTVLETSKITFICDLQHYNFNNSKELICRNSSWVSLDGVPPTCIECGKSELEINYNETSQNISALPKEFPWHVGIYDIIEQPPKLICSGTILSSRMVISVSFCFPGDEVNDEGNEFAIGAGKIYNNWNNPLDTHAQYIHIENVTYIGIFRELAIILLSKHLEINSFVTPICLPVPEKIRDVTIPLTLSFWSQNLENSKETNGTKLKYLKIKIKEDLVVSKKEPSIYCPDKKYWERAEGSALVQQLSNEDKRFYIHSLFSESDCHIQTFAFQAVKEYVTILELFLKRYSN